jgi:hypothetical protein
VTRRFSHTQLASLVDRQPEDRCQDRRRHAGVLQRRRRREDRLQLDRGGEQLPVDVGDLAALRRQVLVLRQLVERHRLQPRLLRHLPPDEPCADRRRRERDDDEEDQCAGTAVGPGEHRRSPVLAAAVGRGI